MKILNIHGYGAIAENTSGNALKKNGYEVVSPQIDYDTQEPYAIKKILEKLYTEQHCEAVTGNSMGGFFAVQLAKEYQCHAVLVNPCVQPFLTLPKLGFENQKFILQYIDLFSNFAKLDFSKIFAIIGEKDDLVNHDFIKYLLGKNNCILVADGGHAGATLPLEEIYKMHGNYFFGN
ncbi:MAG: hypothetical protein K2K06_05920 [Oscillospiraceae bacterium]|nr:hypothetical protein [Oscillospiraceae bacterium]